MSRQLDGWLHMLGCSIELAEDTTDVFEAKLHLRSNNVDTLARAVNRATGRDNPETAEQRNELLRTAIRRFTDQLEIRAMTKGPIGDDA